MTSFQSKLYPRSRNSLLISQEYAMRYYGGLNMIIMLGILVKVVSGGFGGQSMIWAVVIAEIIAIGLGNLMAYSKLHRSYAEIFFVNEHFSLISVHDILFKKENHAFPLRYANPAQPDEDTLTIHFNDQVITLKRENWEEFDLIRDYLYSRQY